MTECLQGNVFQIQRCSLHDGPGIRTTVFLKGCPLRCVWCQNPEGIAPGKSYGYDERKCLSCGKCREACSDEEAALGCPTGAKTVFGRLYTTKDLCQELLSDRDFYEDDGGVTFSGGECLMQSEFVRECEALLKKEGIHTAVDTCGAVDFSAIERVLPVTDLFLYDIKHVDSEKHRRFTGQGNARILENFRRLSERGARIWVRIPVIGPFNGSLSESEAIAAFLWEFPRIERIEVLRYHELGRQKYDMLSMPYFLSEDARVSDSLFADIKAILQK